MILCPHCHAELQDGAAQCHECGVLLTDTPAADQSGVLWGEDDPSQSRVELFTSAQGTQERLAAAAADASQLAAAPVPGGPAQAGEQASIHTQIVSIDPEEGRHTRVVDVSMPAMVRKARKVQEESQQGPKGKGPSPLAGLGADASGLSEGLSDLSGAVHLLLARMHRMDRRTMWITFATLVAAFMPWTYQLGHGLISGIQELGLGSAAAALVVLGAIYARTVRRRLAGLVLVLQVLAAAVCVAIPVYRITLAGEEQLKFGVYLTALFGAIMVVLSLMRLVVRKG